jgi:hypothetical protein
MIADTRMIFEKQFHNGEVPIFDMEGFSLRHLTKVTLPVLKKYMLYTQVCFYIVVYNQFYNLI